MKKILTTSFFLLCVGLSFMQAFAELKECQTGEYCAIRGETNADLQLYIDSNKKVIQNITAIVRNEGTKGNPLDGMGNLRKYIVAGLNKGVDVRRSENLFDFYVLSGMQGALPTPVYRDYQKIVNEGERIEKLMNMLADQLYNDMTLSNAQICSDVGTKCTLNGYPIQGLLSNVLTQLHENNTIIKNIFMLSSLGREDAEDGRKQEYLFLIATSISGTNERNATSHFEQQIEKYYGADAIAQCNQCSGGSFAEISDSIKSIAQTVTKQNDAFDSWRSSWELLIGGKESRRKIENERGLLEKELNRQGLQTENVQVMLSNLDDFNNPENEDSRIGGFTWGNNYISNTYKSFEDNFKKEAETFNSTLDSELYEQSIESDDDLQTASISTENFLDSKDKIDTSTDIGDEIHAMYKIQLENTAEEVLLKNRLIQSIISTHNNLVETAEMMNTTIAISQAVCNSQGAGLGKCD